MTFNEALDSVNPPSESFAAAAKNHWDSIAKPLDSLGQLEAVVIRLAGILRCENPSIKKRGLVIMCADNGVVAQGVTQTDSSVTAIMTENFTKGTTTVCHMARFLGVDVRAVDIGVNRAVKAQGLVERNIMRGTNDISQGAAMTREAAVKAIEVGINLAADLKAEGYSLIATGEMGIGNTTTSSAVAAVLLELDVAAVTGRGAGLDSAGLSRKLDVIRKAIAVNSPDKSDALDVLAKVGGLDIAGMAGLYIGGAAVGLPVMLDGFISGVAAIVAAKICPLSREYMIPSHVSAEPAGQLVLDALGFKPIVTAGMCLGEGTGAMAALSIIDLALEVYNNGIRFSEVNIENYVHLV